MHAKGVAELKAEQVAFSSFKQWCTDTTASKEKSIKEATEEIENLESAIAKAEADAAQLGEEIASLDSDMAGFKSEMQAATEIREKEKEDYKVEHTDLSESVDAVSRAVNVVKKQSMDKAQAMMQLKVVQNLSRTPKQAQRALEAFLQTGQDPE